VQGEFVVLTKRTAYDLGVYLSDVYYWFEEFRAACGDAHDAEEEP
jgi:hypothetical protein